MPLGDSITRGHYGSTDDCGYRKLLYLSLINSGYNPDFVGSQSDGGFAEPNHEGHDGETAAWINFRMDGPTDYWLSDSQPDIILYHIGTNNLGSTDITAYAQDANETLEIIYGFDPNTTVILAKIILTRNDPNRNIRTHDYNILLGDIAQNWVDAGYSIITVDMENALNYPTDMADNLHPNNAGYAKMADVWYEALDNYLGIAPAITSTPVTDGIAGLPYSYDVNATGYPEPNYILTTYPAGMTIDVNTGLIEWLPNDTGDYNVTVEARNGQMPDANQSFTISISTFIGFDANSSGFDNVDDTTFSWTHPIGDGNDRILIVGIAGEDSNIEDLVINSVTYDSVNMNLVAGSSQSVYSPSMYMKTQLYYMLKNSLPPLPGNYTVEVTYNGNVKRKCGGGISLFNVKQQAAEAVDTNSVASGDFISTEIATLTDGAWVVDVVGSSNSGSFTADGNDNHTKRFDVSSNNSSAAGSTKSVITAGSSTNGWFHSGNNRLTHSAAAFAPAERIICGYVIDLNDEPSDAVQILTDSNGVSDMTDPNGYYELSVPYNWSGQVTPTEDGYMFTPSHRIYTKVTEDQVDQDYQETSIYDLDWNGFIGFGDVNIISENWLEIGVNIPGDFYKDTNNIVNFQDFADFANVWRD